MITVAPLCAVCDRFKGPGFSCTAFDDIPVAILNNQVDHRKPFDGDNGLVFEPEDAYAATYAAQLFDSADELKYADDQARDENGRWTSGGGTATEEHKPSSVGSESDTPEQVRDKADDYLHKNYPDSVLGWVKDADWSYNKAVPLADIDMARRPGGARDPKRVADIEEHVRSGNELSPVVLVAKSDGRYALADGYHRTKVYESVGRKTIHAYVAKGLPDKGPWDHDMHANKLNKAIEADLVKEFNPDQPRDDHGRWANAGGSDTLIPLSYSRLPESDTNYIPIDLIRRANDPELQHLLTTERATPDTESRYKKEGQWEPIRADLQKSITDDLYSHGGKAPVEGQPYQPQEIGHDKQMYIVIGPPGAGKSSTVKDLPTAHNSVLIDADEAKQMLPEWNKGKGANQVHEESSHIAEDLLTHRALGAGANMIVAKVGAKPRSIMDLAKAAHDRGYNVHLRYVDVSTQVSMRRVLERSDWYREGKPGGRIINPKYSLQVDHKPADMYQNWKLNPIFSTYGSRSGVTGNVIEFGANR